MVTPASANQPSTAVLSTEDVQPQAFSLYANHPNPFNGGTVIAFDLPVLSGQTAAAVELTVHDLLGQRVLTLVRERLEPGRHEVRWDGRSQQGDELASGVYLYRLTAGSQVSTRRLAILR